MSLARARRTISLVFAMLLVLGGPVAATSQAAGDPDFGLPPYKYPPFYVPPSPLPAGQPGDVIRAIPLSFRKALGKPPVGTRGWLVMYRSTSATGQPIAVTGTVLLPGENIVPKQGLENRPIIGYGNEAIGLGDQCAPSRILQYGQSGEIALYAGMLRRGYAVVATDYEGLGTPAVHTFGVTLSAAHAVLDLVRAARNLEQAGLPKDGPVALLGYSQGGNAVLGADEQQPEYAPDMRLTAVAGGGTPLDPVVFSKRNSGGIFSAVNFAAAAGYEAAYPELDLESEFLNERGLKAVDQARRSCIEAIATLSFKRTSSFLKQDVYTSPKWLARFTENTIGNKPPKTPTYYFTALYDQAAPYRMSNAFRRKWCAGGTPLEYATLWGVEHVSAAPVWMPEAEKWLAYRLEGSPAPGNCGSLTPKTPVVPATTP